MLGANRLAIEAIPLLACAPHADGALHTTGFSGRRASDTWMHWPLWKQPAAVTSVRSMLTLDELLHGAVDKLRARGVGIVLRSQRITVGKVRNFTTATPVQERAAEPRQTRRARA